MTTVLTTVVCSYMWEWPFSFAQENSKGAPTKPVLDHQALKQAAMNKKARSFGGSLLFSF